MTERTEQISLRYLASGGLESGPTITLAEHVRSAVEQYFLQINGHPASNLHAFVIGEVEKPLVETVLKHAGQNQTKASRMLGISRSTLRKKISQYGLE